MLTEQEFLHQLHRIYIDQTFQKWSKCNQINYTSTSLTLNIKPTHRILQTIDATSVLLRIQYSNIYKEPTLYIKLFCDYIDSNGVQISKVCIPSDMTVILPKEYRDSFFIEPEQLEDNVWWCFHQCDTPDIIGDDQLYKKTYLQRWVSIFIFSWLKE